MSNLTVAQTILHQLGGRRFITMTGARDFVGGDSFLLFRLPARFAREGINKVKVILDPSDTYTLEFLKCNFKKHEFQIIAKRNNIYHDQLQTIFTKETGLDTSLGGA